MTYPEPQAVFRYFTEICAIPHGSGQTDAIREYCLQTAKHLGVSATADEAGNVILRKPAASGCEQAAPVILQGHLDMVCAKLPDCPKNMQTDGLDLVWDTDFLSAQGTTLGGDDGIAIAMAFALLESQDIPHPPLTVLLTNDEETGMNGASGLAAEQLDAPYLINLDSEEEGIFTVGCAGGLRLALSLPIVREQASGTLVTLTISGLCGGHSGVEIHKPLLNANRMMAELLSAIPSPIRLCSWEGGVRDNVIPTDAVVQFLCTPCMMTDVLDAISAKRNAILTAYPEETNAQLSVDIPVKSTQFALTKESTAALLETLLHLPNGVQTMHPTLQMPETSLNLGVFRLKSDCMEVTALLRSSVNQAKYDLADAIIAITEQADGQVACSGDYPAWEYQPNTLPLLFTSRCTASRRSSKRFLPDSNAESLPPKHRNCNVSLLDRIFLRFTPRESDSPFRLPNALGNFSVRCLSVLQLSKPNLSARSLPWNPKSLNSIFRHHLPISSVS